MRITDVDHACPKATCDVCGLVFGTGEKCQHDCGAGATFRAQSDKATCGTCMRSWCFDCQPAPGAMCVWCNGTGVDEAARMSVDLDDPEDLKAYLRGVHEDPQIE